MSGKIKWNEHADPRWTVGREGKLVWVAIEHHPDGEVHAFRRLAESLVDHRVFKGGVYVPLTWLAGEARARVDRAKEINDFNQGECDLYLKKLANIAERAPKLREPKSSSAA